jgi:hypothetical protein
MSRTATEAASNFYGSSPGIRLVRLAMGASQRLWPALAVRAAYRVFGTPLPPKWLQRRFAPPPGWRVEPWDFEEATLTVYRPRPGLAPHAPLALLVHGWGGHAGQMATLAESLESQGLQPVIVEMPAHGRSSGLVSNLPQFARAIEYVAFRLQAEGHTLRLLAAHSLGANAAALAAARGVAAQRLVLLAPPASPRAFTHYFARVFGLSERTRSAMQQRIEAREGVLMRQLEPDAVGPRIRVPTLVVHDRGDSVNGFADGQAFAHEIRGARLVATEGLGHRRILRDAGVLAQVALFSR